jgi:F-box domain
LQFTGDSPSRVEVTTRNKMLIADWHHRFQKKKLWCRRKKKTKQKMTFLLLPWEKILCYVDVADVLSAERSCKHFHATVKRDRLWRLLYAQHSFGSTSQKNVQIDGGRQSGFKRLRERSVKCYWRRLTIAEYRKRKGNEALAQRSLDDAVRFYSRALGVRVANDNRSVILASELFSNRCLARLRLGDACGALLDADRCVDLRPFWPKSYFRRGQALQALWQHRGAQNAFFQSASLLDVVVETAAKSAQFCGRLAQAREPRDPQLFERAPFFALAPPGNGDGDALTTPVRFYVGDGHVQGGGAVEREWAGTVRSARYAISGCHVDVEWRTLFEALQMRFVADGDRSHFATEPLDLAREYDVLSRRTHVARSGGTHASLTDSGDAALLRGYDRREPWRCDSATAANVAKRVKAVLARFDDDDDIDCESCKQQLIVAFWAALSDTLTTFDSCTWQTDQEIGGTDESCAIAFELVTNPYCHSDPPPLPAKRRPVSFTQLTLNTHGAAHFMWAPDDDDESWDTGAVVTPMRDDDGEENFRIDALLDDVSDDDDDDDANAEQFSFGKLLIELEFDSNEEHRASSFASVLCKSMMATRTDKGIRYPRYAIVTNGLCWSFVKLDARLVVRAATVHVDKALAEADLQAIKHVMEHMHFFMLLTQTDNRHLSSLDDAYR